MGKAGEIGVALAAVPNGTQRLDNGWAFHYQSRSYVKTRAFSEMLAGHGPVVVLDNGRVLEGCSLDRTPSDVLQRYGEPT
ncbi:YrhB domain-containing protein [Siccirubricoccus soli]|uniref:YrhB domain-containing protein n=1 Tax=Siccirubricoccus soli TaxID=2899147 RepID=UPI003517846B